MEQLTQRFSARTIDEWYRLITSILPQQGGRIEHI